MKNNSFRSVLALALLIGIVMGTVGFQTYAVKADNQDISISFFARSAEYGDFLRLKFGISYEGIDDSTANQIQLLVWKQPMSEYVKGTESSVLSSAGSDEGNGKVFQVFYTEGIEPKMLTQDFYVRGYLNIDGVEYYTDIIRKWSPLEYFYTRLGKGVSPEQEAIYRTFMAYGAACQRFFHVNENRLADATYYSADITGGVMTFDGFNHARVLKEETYTIRPDTMEGFLYWTDGVNTYSGDANGEYTFTVGTDNISFTAVYGDADDTECTHPEEYILIIPEKAATCTEDGYTEERSCTKCGETLSESEVISAGHTLTNDGAWTWEGNGHYQTCMNCSERINEGYHQWNDENVCVVCGAEENQTEIIK